MCAARLLSTGRALFADGEYKGYRLGAQRRRHRSWYSQKHTVTYRKKSFVLPNKC